MRRRRMTAQRYSQIAQLALQQEQAEDGEPGQLRRTASGISWRRPPQPPPAGRPRSRSLYCRRRPVEGDQRRFPRLPRPSALPVIHSGVDITARAGGQGAHNAAFEPELQFTSGEAGTAGMTLGSGEGEALDSGEGEALGSGEGEAPDRTPDRTLDRTPDRQPVSATVSVSRPANVPGSVLVTPPTPVKEPLPGVPSDLPGPPAVSAPSTPGQSDTLLSPALTSAPVTPSTTGPPPGSAPVYSRRPHQGRFPPPVRSNTVDASGGVGGFRRPLPPCLLAGRQRRRSQLSLDVIGRDGSLSLSSSGLSTPRSGYASLAGSLASLAGVEERPPPLCRPCATHLYGVVVEAPVPRSVCRSCVGRRAREWLLAGALTPPPPTPENEGRQGRGEAV